MQLQNNTQNNTKYRTLKLAFAGYDTIQQQLHAQIISGELQKQLSNQFSLEEIASSVEVELFRILVEKKSEHNTTLPFTTDFEEIVYGYFDVLLLGKLYSPPNQKTLSLARQSVATGKHVVVVDPEFTRIYGKDLTRIAESGMPTAAVVKQSYTLGFITRDLAEIIRYCYLGHKELVRHEF